MIPFYFQVLELLAKITLVLTTFLKVLTCRDFNIKCLVAHILLLAKKICNCSHARQKNHPARQSSPRPFDTPK